eukprot:scaffold8601_cov191-Amphora_coffeaeformis.AAC.8
MHAKRIQQNAKEEKLVGNTIIMLTVREVMGRIQPTYLNRELRLQSPVKPQRDVRHPKRDRIDG